MTPDQHSKAKEIFLQACAQPEDQRSAFAANACAGNEAIRREVERLLAHYLPSLESSLSTHAPAPSDTRPGLKNRLSDISEPPEYQTGAVVADRYRIVALLGEGGMGRVYRAEDDRLNQTVALKFLPKLHVMTSDWRRRVESEVKLSRGVGHPNICRVYDLGEIEGSPYISMEYVNGEDLASLLRRVGRLTGQRAIEIARQLCAGLAAAHICGVLHRDLKPANVMIDEEGRVRITDFGLAVLSGHVERKEISAGTPRYMAPEQLAGHSVNEKSDIYSLGLVLYEMFTGRPAFDADDALEYLRLHQAVEPIPPTAIVPEIDPQIEAVILACLRKDPAERPESALNVAAALPGGDLLAAALDAGQIPTREMLAASAAQGKIDRRLMRRAAIVALAMFCSAVLLGNDTHPIAVHGGVKSPDVLREKAMEVARLAGVEPTSKNVDCRFFPSADTDLSRFVTADTGTSLALAISPEEKLVFRYRESDSPVESVNGEVLSFVLPGADPFHLDSESRAETAITLDGQGRLLFFESNAPSSKNASFDQNAIILASGRSPMELIPAPALTIPGFYAEQLQAFVTRPEISPEQHVRIEIAGSHDCVRYLAVLAESTKTLGAPFPSTQSRWTFVRTIRNTVFLLLLIAALLGAWKNWKTHGDLAGAARFGSFIFAVRLLSGLLSTRHIGGYSENIENVAGAAVIALCEGLIIALFYLAAESYVRRWWPRALGCWSRLLAGKLRDPFVGRDVVIGCLVGVFWANLAFLDRRLPGWMGWEARTQLRLFQGLENFLGTRFAVAGVFDSLRGGIYQGLVLLFILVIATWLVGLRRWAALLITWIVGAAMYAPAASHPATAWTLFALGGVGVAVYVLTHWGLVSVLAALLVAGLLGDFPITTDLNAWYAGYGIFAGAAVLGLGAWGLYESLQQSALDTPPL